MSQRELLPLLDAEVGDLGNALRAMDDWDADLLELFGLGNIASDDATPSASPSHRDKRSNSGSTVSHPYKGRPNALKLKKQELEVEVESLQQRLQQLRTQSQNEAVCSNEAQALRIECEAMVARQRQQRLDAEIENTRLRSLLETRFKDARKIAALTKKVSTVELALGSNRTASMANYRGPVVDIGHQVLQLGMLVAGAAHVYANNKFQQHPSDDFRDLQFRECAPDGIEAHFRMSWSLPFPVEKVAAALWIQTTRMNRANRSMDFEDLYSDQSVLASRFVLEPRCRRLSSDPSDPSDGGATHGQIATRIEHEAPNGSVLVVSTVEAKVFKRNGEMKGSMKGDGFLRAEPISDELSRVKWCRIIRGFPPESTCKSKEARVRWIHDLMKGPARQIWQRNLDSNVQAIENMLLSWSQTKEGPQRHA